MTDVASSLDDLIRLFEADPSWVATLTEDDLFAIAREVDEETWKGFVRWLENQDPWRATPATMMVHFGRRYKMWRYTALLGEKFRQAFTGESPRQIWNMPARYGKSLVASQWGPAWALDQDPTFRLILTSYGDKLAVENAVAVRDILRQHKLRAVLRRDRQQAGRFMTQAGGGVLAAGIRSTMAGFGADGAVIDDPHKDWIEAHSKASRDVVDNQVRSVVRLRLESALSFLLLCHTRWHDDDLTGRLLGRMEDETGEAWELVRIPALAEAFDPASPDKWLWTPDALGRSEGEIIEPERFDLAAVRARSLSLGSYLASSLEQQRPSPAEGDVFKRSWWQLDTEDGFSGRADQWITSWDMKLKGKKSGDYVVGQCWARTGSHKWMIDQLRGQWDQPTVENAIALMAVRHPDVRRHVIENTGNGPEVMEALRKKHPTYEVTDEIAGALGMSEAERELVQAKRRRGIAGLIPNTPTGDKTVRARAMTGTVQQGEVHLPGRASFLGVLLEELSAFPNGGHDDVVDALTQAVNYLDGAGGSIQTATDALLSVRAGA